MRSTIVDGNNVIGSRPDGWWRDRAGATRRLVDRLAAWAAAAGEPVTVVFDGPRPHGFDAPDAVEVIFAGRIVADDVIAALVADSAAGERIDVVTSDAGLAARVRAHGARVVGARGFRNRLDGH